MRSILKMLNIESLKIGITYNPSTNLFYSSSCQTSLVLAELFKKFGADVTLVDYKNSDNSWWTDYPSMDGVKLTKLYKTSGLDVLIDVDGLANSVYRNKAAEKIIVFMRGFLQFNEMDNSVYPEKPYMPRSFDNVSEIWCWDIMNPIETIPSIQTLFPCPIKRVPFIWSPAVVNHYMKNMASINEENGWTVHIAEKNTDNTSSSIIPIVAVRELSQHPDISKRVEYKVHNMDKLVDNRFLKENVLNNIDAASLKLEFVPKEPYYEWHKNSIILSHSRFVPIRIGLLNAIWLGIPLIHNSPIIRELHPCFDGTFYFGNEITSIVEAFKWFNGNTDKYYGALDSIRAGLVSKWGIDARIEEWMGALSPSCAPLSCPVGALSPSCVPLSPKEIVVAFSDMWPGFNYETNFFIDALKHEYKDGVIKGMEYNSVVKPALLIFGPFGNIWKNVASDVPKVFFSAENWKYQEEESIKLYITSSTKEDATHFRIPTWMIFIDWFSGSNTLPEGCTDNPIRLPLALATNPHPIPFKDRKNFCAFVVSNPSCEFRNETFKAVNNYKPVTSGGALFNNIGGQLSLKYPGGGCGDISKHRFFTDHRFTLSFENSQAGGYITEKVLHAKMAGCVPLYWGDSETDNDFAKNSFVNLSKVSNPNKVVEVIKLLESNEAYCSIVASTPILDEEKKQKALGILSNMAWKLLELCGIKKKVEEKDKNTGFEKVYCINLDTRRDRWNNLLEAEPWLEKRVTRVPAVNGKTLKMNQFIYNMFK
jgi:hypothetical protein